MNNIQNRVKHQYARLDWKYGATLRFKLDETVNFVCGFLSKSPARFSPMLKMDKGTALATLVLTAYAAANQLGVDLDEEIEAELNSWEHHGR